MTKDEMIKWINEASLEDLMRKWRFAPSGDPFFNFEVGAHFSEILTLRKDRAGQDECVRISKKIGWDRRA